MKPKKLQTLKNRKTTPPTHTTPSTKLYFAYGSNLWLHQMRTRCPSSRYVGTARLPNYRWIINERGYANVVPSRSSRCALVPPAPTGGGRERDKEGGDERQSNLVIEGEEKKEDEKEDEVYGLVYTLSATDEAQLDRNEGVPIAYEKEMLECEFWPSSSSSSSSSTTTTTAQTLPMLTYIDHHRTTPSEPRKEYIVRMNQGIHDALGKGVPASYVDEVLRRYIPRPRGSA